MCRFALRSRRIRPARRRLSKEILDTIPEAREALRAPRQKSASGRRGARLNGRQADAVAGARGGAGGGRTRVTGRGGPPACALAAHAGRHALRHGSHRPEVRGKPEDAWYATGLTRRSLRDYRGRVPPAAMPGGDSLIAELRLHGVVVKRLTSPARCARRAVHGGLRCYACTPATDH